MKPVVSAKTVLDIAWSCRAARFELQNFYVVFVVDAVGALQSKVHYLQALRPP